MASILKSEMLKKFRDVEQLIHAGMKQREACDKVGLAPSSFWNYKKKLEDAKKEGGDKYNHQLVIPSSEPQASKRAMLPEDDLYQKLMDENNRLKLSNHALKNCVQELSAVLNRIAS